MSVRLSETTNRPGVLIGSRARRRRLFGMAGFILLLHVAGWGSLLMMTLGGATAAAQGFGVGLGVTAYVLGLRHAFDADHIVAIDNTTRKLLGDGRRPVAVGFWFSLGHSTVVLVLCLALGFGARTLVGGVENDDSVLHRAAGIWGPLISATFLIVLGVLNARSFTGIRRMAKRARQDEWNESELEGHLHSRGFLVRVLGKLTKSVRKDWHMYPIGLLFGLGFDTATEVSLLVLSGNTAASDLPWYAFAALPILFTAGMSACDTADGVFMAATYEWAFLNPQRRISYNLVVTGISVATAFLAGGIELAGLASDERGLTSGPLAWVQKGGFAYAGYGVAAVFLVTWLVSVAVRRARRRSVTQGAGEDRGNPDPTSC